MRRERGGEIRHVESGNHDGRFRLGRSANNSFSFCVGWTAVKYLGWEKRAH